MVKRLRSRANMKQQRVLQETNTHKKNTYLYQSSQLHI